MLVSESCRRLGEKIEGGGEGGKREKRYSGRFLALKGIVFGESGPVKGESKKEK